MPKVLAQVQTYVDEVNDTLASYESIKKFRAENKMYLAKQRNLEKRLYEMEAMQDEIRDVVR